MNEKTNTSGSDSSEEVKALRAIADAINAQTREFSAAMEKQKNELRDIDLRLRLIQERYVVQGGL